MVKVTRKGNRRRVLDAITGPQAVQEIGTTLFKAANIIATDAQHSITEGSVSGAGHVVSAPGEPPNADTHALDRQIEAVQVAPLRSQVQSNAPHARPLEYGTSRMAARPSIGPAVARNRALVADMVRGAIVRVIKRTGA